jgi:hypothetical protein
VETTIVQNPRKLDHRFRALSTETEGTGEAPRPTLASLRESGITAQSPPIAVRAVRVRSPLLSTRGIGIDPVTAPRYPEANNDRGGESTGMGRNPSRFRALIAHGIRIGLRDVRGGLTVNEHELFAAALEIDARPQNERTR